MKTYRNPWIPQKAIEILRAENGLILDVGGGAAPYYRAAHVIDIQSFDAERLKQNAWGRGGGESLAEALSTQRMEAHRTMNEERFWGREDYTEFDLCSGARWPFADKAFDLGLSSHCLEDIRDPVQVVREMARVCKRTLIICPSRLLEQMRGVDHPRYCGMPHHLWLVFEEDGELVFRRKTPLLEFPGMHLVCPLGKRLTTEAGSMFYLSENPVARELMFFDMAEDKREYGQFVEKSKVESRSSFAKATADMKSKYLWDRRWLGWRRWVWYFRQKWLWEG